jgi:disulfide bond formation protein DsbB
VPSLRVTTNFFLVLTLVANALVVGALLLAAGCVFSRSARRAWRALALLLERQALLLAWIVAIVTTTGSLIYSVHFEFLPCELCWYQRICMYPLFVVLGVGFFRRDRKVWMTAAPLVVVGAGLALYHWLVERVPIVADSSSCSVFAPCSRPYFEKLGFVTLAWMDLSAFLLIGVLLALFVTSTRRTRGVSAPDASTGSAASTPSDAASEPEVSEAEV